MATITVKNIPDDIYEKLKAKANTNRRSINSEIINCIEKNVTSTRIDPEKFIAQIEQIPQSDAPKLNNDMLQQFKESGRL